MMIEIVQTQFTQTNNYKYSAVVKWHLISVIRSDYFTTALLYLWVLCLKVSSAITATTVY